MISQYKICIVLNRKIQLSNFSPPHSGVHLSAKSFSKVNVVNFTSGGNPYLYASSEPTFVDYFLPPSWFLFSSIFYHALHFIQALARYWRKDSTPLALKLTCSSKLCSNRPGAVCTCLSMRFNPDCRQLRGTTWTLFSTELHVKALEKFQKPSWAFALSCQLLEPLAIPPCLQPSCCWLLCQLGAALLI